MLQTHTFYNELAHSIVEAETGHLERRISEANERHRNFMRALNEATTNYILTGIARVPDATGYQGWVRHDQRKYFSWFGYFKKLSHDMKRPFVWCAPREYMLQIARRRYTEPLIGSFMLSAVKIDDCPRWRNPNHPVAYHAGTEHWKFFFNGETRVLIDDFVQACATNPEYRRALRLI